MFNHLKIYLAIFYWITPILTFLQEPEDLKVLRSGRGSGVHPKVFRCGDVGKDLVVNFVNKNYPDNDDKYGECKFRLLVTSPHICQVRVDFVDTEMLPPIRGECISQLFEIEGTVWPTGIPPLCGKNDDQHFYIHLESWLSKNTSFIDFKISTSIREKPYRFGLWLTQIDCSNFNVLKAPEGCTQYFLGEKGSLRSFNFEGSRYLKSTNYQICIRPGKSVCGIRYDVQQNGEFVMRKTMKGNREVQLRAGTGSKLCGSDYLMIPEGRTSLKMSELRRGRLIFKRRKPQPVQTNKNPTSPSPISAPVALRKNKEKKFGLRPSFDRFCGGYLSTSGGDTRNRPIFARVRSNLITLKVRTTGSFTNIGGNIVNSGIRQQQGQNFTVGFKLSYTQLRDCDESEKEMVSHSSITNIIQNQNSKTSTGPSSSSNHHQNQNRDREPLQNSPSHIIKNKLIPSTSAGSLASVSSSSGGKNASQQQQSGGNFTNLYDLFPDDDKMWDYLENDEDSELYDDI